MTKDSPRTSVLRDEKLIARLRMVTGFIRFETGDRIAASACLSEEAADRIEQLAVTNEQLVATNEALTAAVKRFAERHKRHLVMCAEVRVRAEHAEAKLAKAVELLTLCRDMFGEVASPSDPLSAMLNETLAEIKGESHD